MHCMFNDVVPEWSPLFFLNWNQNMNNATNQHSRKNEYWDADNELTLERIEQSIPNACYLFDTKIISCQLLENISTGKCKTLKHRLHTSKRQ